VPASTLRWGPIPPPAMLVAALLCLSVAWAAAESGSWPLSGGEHHHHHHPYRGDSPAHDEPTITSGGDPLRVRTPAGGSPPLLPLQWGTVQPAGWIRDWATTASQGAVSPANSWFASGKGIPITQAQHSALMNNGTVYPPGVGRANGWKDGQPSHPWTMAEQSAYWMDGMTRLGLVLNDSALKARTAEDITAVIEGGVLSEPQGGPEGWPRSVYSRAMLAYLDGTGDKRVLSLFEKVWNSSYEMNAEKDARSMTQAEAMLEGYAYGGSATLLNTALRGLSAHQASFQQAWNSPRCDDYSVNSSCVTASYEVSRRFLCTSFKTVYLPLSCSGNPGVNGESYRGANWKRLGHAARARGDVERAGKAVGTGGTVVWGGARGVDECLEGRV
jgi:hypothetical protein